MRRLLAVLALLFGGLATEAVKPVQCELITNTQMRRRGGARSVDIDG